MDCRLPEATIREDLPTILEKFNLLHDEKDRRTIPGGRAGNTLQGSERVLYSSIPMGIVSGLFSAIPAKLLGTTRQLPHSYPTVTPQMEKVLSAIGGKTLSTKEIMGIIGLKDKSNFLELYLYPATRQNLVEPIYPENPKHPRQKYRLTEKGKALLK